ncbi:hypothetical protein [Kineococcus rubinsiae]|uniref:hypothetical protein n=1 Tax=Kineococcus rubinsiae TaxID=2609562 RepID=UPI0014303728|nr:hypothetical protein [Kineococcus rubinsiae]NIZ90383.1 hypothetical protein [Kineococcus rubinsiae]
MNDGDESDLTVEEQDDRAADVSAGGNKSSERLARATVLLRQHTDIGWKAIEDNVIARALTLYRPSAPVRGHHEYGDFFLAADLLVAQLRSVIDAVPSAAARDITCVTDAQDHLESVTIQLIAAYGASLLEVANRIHAVAVRELRQLLGTLAPTAGQVHTHVHFGDVSDDPSVVN